MRRNAVYGVPTPDPEDWGAQGACRDYGAPDLWFSVDPVNEREAVEVCNRCPILTECRRKALANREINGVWGGLTQRQLRNLVKGAA